MRPHCHQLLCLLNLKWKDGQAIPSRKGDLVAVEAPQPQTSLLTRHLSLPVTLSGRPAPLASRHSRQSLLRASMPHLRSPTKAPATHSLASTVRLTSEAPAQRFDAPPPTRRQFWIVLTSTSLFLARDGRVEICLEQCSVVPWSSTWATLCGLLLFRAIDSGLMSSSNVLAIPTETSSVEAQSCMGRNPCEIENRSGGPSGGLYFQNLAWDDNKTVEPRTGVEFPTMLGDFMSVESNSSFTPEVLVGTGSRTMTIIRIKTLKVYAFAFYVHPFDVCEKLGSKYACIPEDELNKCQDFYRDLLREDINMTIRLVINCNGIKINTMKDVFIGLLLTNCHYLQTNPHADFSCLQTFGSIFSQDIPLHVGTTINFRRAADGHLITEVGGKNIGAVHSKDLC
ncbi:Fatty-acid-binding protein 2, partial [Striga hermonthica]